MTSMTPSGSARQVGSRGLGERGVAAGPHEVRWAVEGQADKAGDVLVLKVVRMPRKEVFQVVHRQVLLRQG